MPYFSNKTDEIDHAVDRWNFKPSTHYEGEEFPVFYDVEHFVDLSDDFDTDPFLDTEYPTFLKFYLDDEGNIRSPLSLREYRQGKLTKMRLGKFVTRFFPDVFTPEELTQFVMKMTEPEIKFGTNFRDVYERSSLHASSCMAGKFSEWRNSPLDVYDGGDLQIAYMEDRAGNITNRVIVWPEKKWMYGMYGNSVTTFQRKMQALGYETHELTGARLKFMTRSPIQKDYMLIPYIDGSGGMSMDENGQLFIGRCANSLKFWNSSTDGYTNYHQLYDEVNRMYGYLHEMVKCKHPYGGNDIYVHKAKFKDTKIDPWGYLDMRKSQPSYYRENMYPRHFFTESSVCTVLGVRVPNSHITTMPDGSYISFEAIARGYRRDLFTNKLHPISEMKELNNGTYFHYPTPESEDQAVQAVA